MSARQLTVKIAMLSDLPASPVDVRLLPAAILQFNALHSHIGLPVLRVAERLCMLRTSIHRVLTCSAFAQPERPNEAPNRPQLARMAPTLDDNLRL